MTTTELKNGLRRTTIVINEKAHKAVRQILKKKGVSYSEWVRREEEKILKRARKKK